MGDPDVGKLFVGGISRDTTEATLKEHFSKYGDVSSSVIAKDRLTNMPRGFGFVTFSDPAAVHRALQEHHHFIHARTVEVKKALRRGEVQQNTLNKQLPQQQQPQQQQLPSPNHSQTSKGLVRSSGGYGVNNGYQHLRAKKIFVGGLSASLTEEEFKGYFEKFGRITDVVVMHDNNTNRPRGFGFITFDSEEVVEKIMQKNNHELAGKRVEVKKAIPREATKFYNNGNNLRSDSARFSPSAGYVTEESYWPRGPTYGTYGQVPLPTTYPGYYYSGGVYSSGYPFAGGYNILGYGLPMVPPRGPWNSFGMVPARPVNYGTGFYTSGLNGGFPFMGMVNPYSIVEPGANGKPDHSFSGSTQVPAKDATPTINGARSDVDASSLKMGKGAVSVRKNSRTSDAQAQTKATPTGQSS